MGRFFGLGIVCLAAACGSTDGGALDSSTDEASPIAAEHPNGVAQMAPRSYDDGELTRLGYAAPDVGGCTGTMIGPNIVYTAAHCGGTDRQVTFYTYAHG